MSDDTSVAAAPAIPMTRLVQAGRVAGACAALAVLPAALVLVLGWGAGWEPAVRLRPGYAAMVPGTTICFLLLGGGLLLRRRAGGRPALLAAALAAGLAVVELAVLALRGQGLDALFLPNVRPADAMAFATASLVLLAAYGLAALARPALYARWLYEITATLGLLAALVALVGYAFDAEALYAVFFFTAMALHTALVFVLLFLALLLLRPGETWVGLVLREGAGSAAARRLMPLSLGLPFLLCLIVLQMSRAGLVQPNFRLSLLAIAMMGLLTAAVLRSAVLENRSEARLLEALARQERTSADRAVLLSEVYHRVKNNLQQINAMLRVESRRFDDPGVRRSFLSMTDRVQALGAVHEILISGPAPSQVDLAEFLRRLTARLAASHDLERQGIALRLDAVPARAHLDVAISLGLLVNELVVNAVRHAFDAGGAGTGTGTGEAGPRGGTVTVAFGPAPEGGHLLSVADDGRGAGPDFPAERATNTGSLLIRGMVAQLNGRMDVDRTRGTRVSIHLPGELTEGVLR